MSYGSRYVKSGQNLSLENEKNILDKRRPIYKDLKILSSQKKQLKNAEASQLKQLLQ